MRDIASHYLAFVIAWLLLFILCAMCSCRSSRHDRLERVDVATMAASHIDAQRRVLMASNLPLSIPVPLCPADSQCSGQPSRQPSPVPWVLAIEETRTADASDVQQAQHWDQSKEVSSSPHSVLSYYLAAFAFFSCLVAAFWIRMRRP